MNTDILDLIDGAVEQHGDAMRWSPEPDVWENEPDTVDSVTVAAIRRMAAAVYTLRLEATPPLTVELVPVAVTQTTVNDCFAAYWDGRRRRHRARMRAIHAAYHRRHR
jgi:hypothetical protein